MRLLVGDSMILSTATFEEYVTHTTGDEGREWKERKGRERERGREGRIINLTRNKLTRFQGDSGGEGF